MTNLTCRIVFPNGDGYTPCSPEYQILSSQIENLRNKYPSPYNTDSFSAEDYQEVNVMENELLSMQASGEHLGKSVVF
jgi:hypothetical protein